MYGMNDPIVLESIEKRIYLIRGLKVMLDSDLAELYGVSVKRLNEQVRRNRKRFPPDFMFQLDGDEHQALRSQLATLDVGRGKYRKYLPLAFTEQGVAMLSGVLHSDRAIQVNVAIMRAFVKLRETLALHRDLARKLQDLEDHIAGHDAQIQNIFEAIKQLMEPPVKPMSRIGFHLQKEPPLPPCGDRGGC